MITINIYLISVVVVFYIIFCDIMLKLKFLKIKVTFWQVRGETRGKKRDWLITREQREKRKILFGEGRYKYICK